MRFCIKLEYDGHGYAGWQRQENAKSVQSCIEDAAKNLLGEDVLIFGSGRTDSGVHALGQFCHFDCSKKFESYEIRDGLNYYLKEEKISILFAQEVSQNFHSRFSAIERSYVYKIINRRSPPAIDFNKKWHIPLKLDVEKMKLAAEFLIGTHDFSTFRGANCQSKSPVKKIDKILIIKNNDDINIKVIAKSFLYKQVRSIVGSLKCVGHGRWSVIAMKEALDSCDRTRVGFVAPAHGLYLYNVRFPKEYNIYDGIEN